MLKVRDLRVRYGSIVAVEDIDLDLVQGQTLALLGRSGSGKTTVLKAIAGLVPISRGTIEIGDRDVTATPSHLREIGMVFQDFALFPHLDVGDNIAYGLRMRGVADLDRRVGESLDMVGMKGMERRRIDQLSGGQAQRVALARTLATRPRLLLLDEPLGSLDPDLRSGLAAEVKRLIDDTGVPTIVVTHDTSEAFAFGDEVAVIVDGRIAAAGPPAQVWRDPGTVEVARLVGHRSFLTVTIDSGAAAVGATHLPVEAPDGVARLLVVPGAASTPGPIDAEVADLRYRGPDWVVVASVPEGTVELSLESPVPIGERITLALDPAGIKPLG